MTPRKKTCTKCGRRLWIGRDFYTRQSSACKDCTREAKRAEYARNRKVKDGVRYDPCKGRCIEHEGYATRIHWSGAMIEKLRRIFPTTKNEDLAVEFGVSPRTVIRKARELGLEKNREWMRAHARRNCEMMRIFNKCRGNSGMFKKGVRKARPLNLNPNKEQYDQGTNNRGD